MSLASIVIPTHSRPELLRRLLRSIAGQTFKDFETIVIDDASPQRDDYMSLVKEFTPLLGMKYTRNEENRGAQYSRNLGIKTSSGEFVAFVDDDDEWFPSKLEKQITRFLSAPEDVGLMYSWADSVASDGSVVYRYRSVNRGSVLDELLHECFIPSPTVMVRRIALLKTGGFDETFVSCQDWDMWTRIASAGFKIDVVEEVLALHHKHEGPSIGTSSRSLQGFDRYYSVHEDLYRKAGMEKELSENYRSIAHASAVAGDLGFARKAFRNSIRVSKANWKAWIRFSQFLLKSYTAK